MNGCRDVRPDTRSLRSAISRGLLAIALGMGGLTVVGSSPAAAATALSVSPTEPIKGETFMVSAQLPTAFARPVSLQRLSGSRWVTVKKGTTSSPTYGCLTGNNVGPCATK